MIEGEKYAAASHRNTNAARQAEEIFNKALKYGIDTEFVTKRAGEVALGDYRITIHGAIILPVKPNTNKNWDGYSPSKTSSASIVSSILKATEFFSYWLQYFQ